MNLDMLQPIQKWLAENEMYGKLLYALATATVLSGRTALEKRESGADLENFGRAKTGEGILSRVTVADYCSQDTAVHTLLQYDPNMRFIVEELKGPANGQDQFLPHNATSMFLRTRTTAVIDPIDCTILFESDCAWWAVSLALHENGRLIGGCIYAPEILNGFLAIAGLVNDMFQGFYLQGSKAPIPCHIKEIDDEWLQDTKKIEQNPLTTFRADIQIPIVCRGISFMIERQFLSFAHHVAQFTVPLEIGPCSLGLAFVATGKIHAYMHKPLPWHDLAAGVALVLSAGGKVQYYQIAGGKVQLLEEPNIFGNTGFIAGHPVVVDWLTEKLVQLYGQPLAVFETV